MALLVQIHEARQLDEGVWKARLSPSEIRFLDPKAENAGPLSVLLLTENPAFDRESRSLSFNPAGVKLLNAGTSDTAILIGTALSGSRAAVPSKASQTSVGSGDARFLQLLPSNLKDFGAELLREVRSQFPGDLAFYPASGKYVQAPDNFWTIRPQPRDGSFRITVRGKPDSFTITRSLELKPDMTGYSSFKVERTSQIEDLIRVLRQVRRK
jgi:hypothetical protein